ncbi:MAG: gliding motility-associated C-terminal domain-containing protein [Prevotella sp.]
MRFKTLLLLVAALLETSLICADELPSINPTATVTTPDGEETGTSYSGSAPIVVRLEANAEDVGAWNAHYEWRFTTEGNTEPYLIRYEENTEYTFTKAGVHHIELYATFTLDGDTIAYTEDYWGETGPITISVSESKLEFPNAFSPNGDGINDIYRAKPGYQSIVEFHAYIFNRWGQKIFDWTDPAEGWDGTYKGKDVKQGVYYVLVKAKGADGRNYNIKKDVNLLRGFTETSGGSSTMP